MVHGPVLTRERARGEPRARRLGHNARRDPCHTSFLPSSFPSRGPPGAPLRRDISSYILRYLDTFHDLLLSFVTSAVSSSCFVFLFFFLSFPSSFTSAQRFCPSNLPSPFSRAISPRYVPDNTLSRIYAFLSLLPLTYPCLLDKISAVICERINFIVRKEQVLKGTYDAVVFIRN